ncbi:protein tilB-like [Drosophila serrata]|uniref:protein tilB-like n=1 Tax=Drosophila serrata TaxID=7274 RepID=UPI000A1D0DF0|nr:protein tilB-like [Drosophila serrata]
MVRITEELVRKKSEHNERLISTLEEISLHQEDIEVIEHIQNWCRDLKILLLQSNLIARLENLHKLKCLEYLNVAINNIERVENLEGCESLNKLDLTLNFIGELTSVESLRGNHNLRELLLIGNPCVDYPHYRDYVVATLPQLTSLDCVEITPSERLQAIRELAKNRAIIVQRQADQSIERDEQRIRVAEQQAALAEQCAGIEDEEERIKAFWQAKSEHCPEIRTEIARQHRLGRERHEPKSTLDPPRRERHFFAPDGRPYNMNQAKLPFKFQDEADHYQLQLEVYRHLDTSLIDVDVQTNYTRVTVKGKIFQIAYNEEVKPDESTVQRSQTTGHLMVILRKLKVNELLTPKATSARIKPAPPGKDAEKDAKGEKLRGVVDISNICPPADLPDLI